MTSTQTSCSLDSTQSEGNSGDEDESDEMLDPRVKVPYKIHTENLLFTRATQTKIRNDFIGFNRL